MTGIPRIGYDAYRCTVMQFDALQSKLPMTITLRNLDPELASRIREQARRSGASLASTVRTLLEERLGIRPASSRRAPYTDLDHLAGRWADSFADAFDAGITEQRSIDPGLWD